MPDRPAPDSDTLVPIVSKRGIDSLHADLKRHKGFAGIMRRGDETFAVFSVKPGADIIKAVKETK